MNSLDIHVHAGRLLHFLPHLEIEDLIGILDQYHIDRACLMAVENPEEGDYYFTTEQVLAACARYPDRLIPFCNVDPRHRYPESFDPRPVIEGYMTAAAKGLARSWRVCPLITQDYRRFMPLAENWACRCCSIRIT